MSAPENYQTIVRHHQSEMVIKSSKFIAFAYPVETNIEIQQIIRDIKSQHTKAKHWCYAWKLGTQIQQNKAFDDGEPSGTAGKPILNQLDSFKLTNIIVVVVRYFGGTLLGTSGLIKAYKESARLCLKEAQIIPIIEYKKFTISCSMDKIQSLLGIIKAFDLKVLKYSFIEPCFIQFEIPANEEYLWFTKIKSKVEKVNNTQIENPKSIMDCILTEDEK